MHKAYLFYNLSKLQA